MNATDILKAAAATLDQRGKDYDQPHGERSMGRIVDTFNALTGHTLTEAQGWQFMACLKLVRMGTAADPTDSAIDCAAYAALAGEALGKEGQAPEDDGWIKWEGGDCPVAEDMEFSIKSRDHGVVTFSKPGRDMVYVSIDGGPRRTLCDGGKFRGPVVAAGDCSPDEFADLCRKWWRAHLRNGGC